MMFRIEQKVVCITDAWNPGTLSLVMPRARRIYVVRDITLRPWSDIPHGLQLVGINNAVANFTDGTYEPYFDAEFFRPVVERSTDITFAHEILRTASRKDRVPA